MVKIEHDGLFFKNEFEYGFQTKRQDFFPFFFKENSKLFRMCVFLRITFYLDFVSLKHAYKN